MFSTRMAGIPALVPALSPSHSPSPRGDIRRTSSSSSLVSHSSAASSSDGSLSPRSVRSVSSTAALLEDVELGSASLCASASAHSGIADPEEDVSKEDEPAHGDNVLGILTVLTLNVWVKDARTRLKDQIQSIRQLDPDVICLQEVFDAGVLHKYGSAFPDYELVAFGKSCTSCAAVTLVAGVAVGALLVWAAVNLVLLLLLGIKLQWLILQPVAMVLVCLVSRHHFWFVFLWGNKTGLAMLVRRSAIELNLDQRLCHVFSPQGHAEDCLNKMRPRGYILVPGRLRLRGMVEPLRVNLMTTHLNQPMRQPRGAGRHRQVQELIDRLTEDSCDGLVVVAGDLNATPPCTKGGTNCNTYRSMTEHLSDAWTMANSHDRSEGLTWDQQENPLCVSSVNRMFFGAKTLRWRCDYIFWRCTGPCLEDASAVLKSCEMVFTGKQAVSDHFGVLATFEIQSGGGNTRAPEAPAFQGRRRPDNHPPASPHIVAVVQDASVIEGDGCDLERGAGSDVENAALGDRHMGCLPEIRIDMHKVH